MTVVKAIRTSTNESRYVPAFFQHGTKVLAPVHAYGYCSAATKAAATMTKRIYLPHMNISDCFKEGQKVGVAVSELTAPATNYWSDGTVGAIAEANITGHYIDVAIDTAIDIAWGGESEISLIADTIVEAVHEYFSAALLWNTVDSKKYITAVNGNIYNVGRTVLYNPATLLSNKMVLASAVDKYLPQTDAFTTSASTKYFVLDSATGSAFNGKYYQYCGATIPVGYTTDYPNYGTQVQGEVSKVMNTKSPMFWDRLGHMDGTVLHVYNEGDTWFKDRSFVFRIRGEAVTIDQVLTYMQGTVVYITAPFNVSHNADAHQFCLSVPSTVGVSAVKMPIDTNYWTHGQINGEPLDFLCDFRPAIDDEGMPYIKNVGNDAQIATSGDETICVFETLDVLPEKFLGCTFDVFASSPENENDLFVGGQTSIDKFLLDIGNDAGHTTLESLFEYASTDADFIERATYPVMLSKMNMISATAPNKFTRSVGSWEDCEYFNGKLWFVAGNVLKPTNTLLEFDPVDTVEIPSAILGIKALANQLFIMAADGVWTINLKNEVEYLSSIIGSMWASVAESLYIVDTRGRIYNTEFTPIPASDQRKVTENPYMVLALNTSMIQDIADQWEVFDIASAFDMLWVASNHGLWAMESSTKAWFKVSNDVFLRLIVAGGEVYGMTGNMRTANEMTGIDLKKLLVTDTEAGS